MVLRDLAPDQESSGGAVPRERHVSVGVAAAASSVSLGVEQRVQELFGEGAELGCRGVGFVPGFWGGPGGGCGCWAVGGVVSGFRGGGGGAPDFVDASLAVGVGVVGGGVDVRVGAWDLGFALGAEAGDEVLGGEGLELADDGAAEFFGGEGGGEVRGDEFVEGVDEVEGLGVVVGFGGLEAVL